MTLMQGCDSVLAARTNLQDRSQSPPSAAVRLTRSQLSKKPEVEREPKSLVDGLGQTSEEEQDGLVSNSDNPTIETSEPTDMSETAMATIMDAPASPLPTAVPKVVKSLRSETTGKRSTSNKENVQPESERASMASPGPRSSMYDTLEDAVVAAATPPRSEARASPIRQDPIAALDDLEDAVESVNKDIPEVQTSPEKPKPRKEENVQLEAALEALKVEVKNPEVKKGSKKAAPFVRTTKASQARLSMAQNKDATGKAPASSRPRLSTTLGRSQSVRQSVAPKAEGVSKRVASNPTTSTVARAKSLKASTNEPREKKETVIPHSKPRPISLSFPTPPPPQKSMKATTQSSFHLPGEAVAAKLKAAREARQAREAEDAEKKEKKVAFKARPAPKTSGEVPSVRQTNASRARESILSGKPAPGPIASHKRSNTVANTDRPRTTTTTTSSKPAPTTARPRPSTSQALNVTKARASTSTSSTLVTKPVNPTQQRAGSGTARGKEVFSRAANAKLAAETAKAEKEAAAKKARAEAAERGRVASREWAEKQRLRKLGIKPEGVKKAVAVVVVDAKAETGGSEQVIEGQDDEGAEATAAPEAGEMVAAS